MLSLKDFKQLITTAPLITIKNAPVTAKVHRDFVELTWRGTESGTAFFGCVNDEQLKEAKFISTNSIAIRLCYLDEKQNLFINAGYTPISFWHKVELPIIHR